MSEGVTIPIIPRRGQVTRPDVELRVPADGAYVAVLRTTTAGLAARLDFTLDDIEDLRIAVGEACSMVLAQARADGDLRASFELGETALSVTVSTDADHPAEPDQSGFAWQVLTALTAGATAQVDEGTVAITLSMTSTLAR